jgi:hypothetical protein
MIARFFFFAVIFSITASLNNVNRQSLLLLVDRPSDYFSDYCKNYCSENGIEVKEISTAAAAQLSETPGNHAPSINETHNIVNNEALISLAADIERHFSDVCCLPGSVEALESTMNIESRFNLKKSSGKLFYLRNKVFLAQALSKRGIHLRPFFVSKSWGDISTVLGSRALPSDDNFRAFEFIKLHKKNFSFPIVIKSLQRPDKGRQVLICDNLEDVHCAFSYLTNISKHNEDTVIIEEFINGTEYGVDIVVRMFSCEIVVMLYICCLSDIQWIKKDRRIMEIS